MENDEKKSALKAFIAVYDGHSLFFKNAIDGLSDKDANNRLGTKANHVSWIAGSLVHERYELTRLIDNGFQYTPSALFEDHKGIQDDAVYPALDEYRKQWAEITPILKTALQNLSEDQLKGPDPFGMPGGDYTLFDAVTFCIDRESYCIGQIGLYRRLLGYPAMKWE